MKREKILPAWSWQGSREICREVELPDLNQEIISKPEIKEALFNHHYKQMKVKMDKLLQ